MRRVLALLAIGFIGLAAPLPAFAADSVFTVKNIPVDATAAAAVDAQRVAINQGRPKAWTVLYRRLTKQDDWPRQPVLSDNDLEHMIKTFSVSNERRSTTRYVANVTYFFRPGAVERILRVNDIAFSTGEAHGVLIVPLVAGLYKSDSGWVKVWHAPRFIGGQVPIIPPSDDPADQAAASLTNFDSTKWSDVAPMAARVHASDAVLASVESAPDHLTVKMRRLGPGQPIAPSVDVPVAAAQPPYSAYSAAADAVASAIVDAWKGRTAIDYNQHSTVMVDARLPSLAAWADLQNKLTGIQTVTSVDTVAIDPGQVRFSLAYVGAFDQLRDALSQAGLGMTTRDGVWWIAVQQQQASNP